MTATVALSARPAPGRGVEDRNVEDRGVLTISESALETLAATAAGEVEHVGGAARRVLGVATGGDPHEGAVRSDASITGPDCSLTLRLSVDYPAPVRAVTAAVRAHLAARVLELTGLRVRRVDVDVDAMTGDVRSPGRRVS